MTWTIEDRTVLVTGGNSGIGLATATELARRGADLVITCRTSDKGTATAEVIETAIGRRPEIEVLDLADLADVRRFAERFLSTHDDLGVLINNAGGIFGSRRLTVDGYEMTIATNHLGPFLLTELLMPALTTHAPSRVINVASSGHVYAEDGIRLDDLQFERKKFSQREVYGHSKLANILHVRELDRRYADRGVTAYAVHPGVVRTQFGAGGDSWIIGFGMKLIGWRFRSPEEGAETSVWAATEPGIESMSGGYFADSAPSKSTRHAKDDEAAQALWDLSEALVGLSSAES